MSKPPFSRVLKHAELAELLKAPPLPGGVDTRTNIFHADWDKNIQALPLLADFQIRYCLQVLKGPAGAEDAIKRRSVPVRPLSDIPEDTIGLTFLKASRMAWFYAESSTKGRDYEGARYRVLQEAVLVHHERAFFMTGEVCRLRERLTQGARLHAGEDICIAADGSDTICSNWFWADNNTLRASCSDECSEPVWARPKTGDQYGDVVIALQKMRQELQDASAIQKLVSSIESHRLARRHISGVKNTAVSCEIKDAVDALEQVCPTMV